eukprot:5045119-Prymnesium_polylepis.1
MRRRRSRNRTSSKTLQWAIHLSVGDSLADLMARLPHWRRAVRGPGDGTPLRSRRREPSPGTRERNP